MLRESNQWKVFIVDDEELIHDNLEMNLRDIEYENKKIKFLHSFSASEARNIIKNDREITVIILDVMMEEDSAGLDFVRFVRDEIKNDNVRILLHTGQPGIAPKKEVASQYMIDAYLDKNVTDNDDSYAAVRVALRSYKERLELKNSSVKTDTDLMKEIADHYIHLMKNSYQLIKYEELLLIINSMLQLSQQILASYAMQDLNDNLVRGTTKSQRLSSDDYSSLIYIHNLKIILAHTPNQQYQKEKVIIFDTITNAARSFASIKILPEASKKELEKYLPKTSVH
ncbi:MAG: response regulator [Proteobacteria bacterium]|nr:response regulator [Pseudomonadota bacterium]